MTNTRSKTRVLLSVTAAAALAFGLSACGGSSSSAPSESASTPASASASSSSQVPTFTEKSTSQVRITQPPTINGVVGVGVALDKSLVARGGAVKVGVAGPENLVGKNAYVIMRSPEFDPEIWDSGVTLTKGSNAAIGATSIATNQRTQLFQVVVTNKPNDSKVIDESTIIAQSQIFTIYVEGD
ncbi:MAG: hypothetical protein WAS05_08870 [Candidatus Nanopelagicales bacterium]